MLGSVGDANVEKLRFDLALVPKCPQPSKDLFVRKSADLVGFFDQINFVAVLDYPASVHGRLQSGSIDPGGALKTCMRDRIPGMEQVHLASVLLGPSFDETFKRIRVFGLVNVIFVQSLLAC